MESEDKEQYYSDNYWENYATIVQIRMNFSPTNNVNGINEEVKRGPKRDPNRQSCKIFIRPPFFNWFGIQNVLNKMV